MGPLEEAWVCGIDRGSVKRFRTIAWWETHRPCACPLEGGQRPYREARVNDTSGLAEDITDDIESFVDLYETKGGIHKSLISKGQRWWWWWWWHCVESSSSLQRLNKRSWNLKGTWAECLQHTSGLFKGRRWTQHTRLTHCLFCWLL